MSSRKEKETPSIRVLIVEDHPVVREAYRVMLEGSGDIEVVAEADTAEAGYTAYQQHRPDLVIMDLSMPGAGGLTGIKRITQWDPKARILVFSMHENPSYQKMAQDAGAIGYVNKRSTPDEMLGAVRRAARGKAPLSANEPADDADLGREETSLKDLSLREFEVFNLLAQGHSVQDIATILNISPNTSGVHKTRIMKKLGVSNAAQLARLAIRHGIVQP